MRVEKRNIQKYVDMAYRKKFSLNRMRKVLQKGEKAMKKAVIRMISMALVAAMCVPFAAYAAEYDLSAGSVTVTGGAEGGQTVTHGSNAAVADNTPVITQSSATTSNTITVDGSAGSASVTIQDVNIDTGSDAPAISTSGDATIIVSGDNSVQSDGAAIDADGSLTISGAASAADGDDTAENSLTVSGGDTAIDVDAADDTDGDLTIGADVTVTATGDVIGVDADVTVNGGNLNAYGDVYGNTDTTETIAGIDGDLTVNSGAAGVYGEDSGVKGDVAVNESGSAIIHTNGGTAVTGNTSGTGKVTMKTGTTYIPESTGTMYYSLQKDDYSDEGYTTFDIQGYYDGKLCGTTYSDDGYETYLRINNDVSAVLDLSGTKIGGLDVSVGLSSAGNGKLIRITYTVVNTSDSSVVFDLGTGADIKIYNNDQAQISSMPGDTGFMMEYDSTEGAEVNPVFAFFGKGYEGVTNVDGFWHGKWSGEWNTNKKTTVFKTEPSQYNNTGYDSAASWCWLDKEIAAGQTQTFTVLLGVGEAEELKDAAGDNELIPDEPSEIESAESTVINHTVKQPDLLDIKLDNSEQTIDLVKGTQAGEPMNVIEAGVEILSGNSLPKNAAIVVREVKTDADNTVEDLPKEDVGMAFTVACIKNGVVTGMPGKVQLSIPVPEGNLDSYKLVFVGEGGKLKDLKYEIVDGEIVFVTKWVGLYMLVKE